MATPFLQVKLILNEATESSVYGKIGKNTQIGFIQPNKGYTILTLHFLRLTLSDGAFLVGILKTSLHIPSSSSLLLNRS